jgi:hypothetical protein
MARATAIIHAFNHGEASVAGMARIDQERVRLDAETQENLFPHVVGKGQVRPGTQYLGNTASNNRARLIQFVKSIDETAVLELTDSKLRVWVGDALVTRSAVTCTVGNGTFATASATITVTIASPAVVSWSSHGFSAGQAVSFATSGALPTGMSAGTTYYVLSTGLTSGAFRFSTTAGGSAVNTSGTQSGSHVGYASWVAVPTGLLSTGASIDIDSNTLIMQVRGEGGAATVKQRVATSSAGTEHALKIVITRGPVSFRCGSTEGGEEYIEEASLDVGEHRLAFTPSGDFWVQFFTLSKVRVVISNCTVESSGVMEIAAPWTAAELREIRFDQSADIVYLAHTNWQQRKVERRGDASWSLVKYKADDGPFASQTSDVRLNPSVLEGVGSLTSNRPFFSSDHVGALFRLFQLGHSITQELLASDEYTDAVQITGIGAGDRSFGLNITGLWTGTLTLQRSYTSADDGFIDVTEYTVNQSITFEDSPDLDAVELWYRIGFKSGEYGSGSAVVDIRSSAGGGWGICRVTAFSSSSNVDMEVLTKFRSTTDARDWEEGEWSDKRGWPSAVALFDGRLWWAREDRFWASESDDYTAFNLDTEGDAGSIQRSIATGGAVNFTQWLLPLQRLVFGTDGSEATARASTFDEPLTPTNVGVKDASSQGVAPVTPAKMDGRGVFVQRSGTKIYEIYYSLERQDYVSTDLTKLNEDIGGDGILEVAVQRQPQSYVWMVRSDGECPVLLYDPSEQVAGFIRYIAAPSIAGDAEVESVCVLPEDEQDAVYLAVKRTINGSTVRFVEKLAKHSEAIGAATNKMADAATLTAGPVSSVTVAHLASETGLVAWGTNSSTGVSGPITGLSADGSGVVALGATYTNVWLGLKYSWRYKTAKLAYGASMTALLQRKRVTQVGLLAANIHHNAVTFGADFTTMRKLPRTQLGETVSETAVEATYDFSAFPFPGGWSTDSRVCLKGEAPYPATLLGLLIGVETNEK